MKYFAALMILFAVAVIGSYLVRNGIISNSPPFIIKKLEELRRNRILMDSISEDNQFEFTYNKYDFNQKDTVFAKIYLRGPKGTLVYESVHFYNDSLWFVKREKTEILMK